MTRRKKKTADVHISFSKNHLQPAEPKNSYTSFALDDFFNKNGHFILIGLIAIMALFVFKDFILQHKFYFFRDVASDQLTQVYTSAYNIADYLRTEGFPRWSFKQGLGQNIFPFSLSDPFVDILYIFGKDHVANSLVYIEILKIFCVGLIFYLLMRKLAISGIAAVIGALSYGFSGFLILRSGWWGSFSTSGLVFLAFLLYSFEKLFQDNDWRFFPLVICLITAFQPFYLYMEDIFLLGYALLRIIESGSWHWKTLYPLLLKIAGLGLLGVLISSFFSVAIIQMMLESTRVGSASLFQSLMGEPMFSFASAQENMSSVLRLFSNNLLGIGFSFGGWLNYLESPELYCGIINLLLLPQLFLFLDRKRKIVYAVLFCIFTVPIFMPFFRHAFWLFAGWYYQILSFFVAILIILYSVKALTLIYRRGRVNLPVLFATMFLLLLGLYFPYPYLTEHPTITVDKSLRLILTGSIIGYSMLIVLLRFPRIKPIALALLILSTGAELGYDAYLSINKRPVITPQLMQQRAFYNDYTDDAVRYLHSVDNNFFRLFKLYPSGGDICGDGNNDAKVQNFYGLRSYHSFNQKYYIRFLGELNLVDTTNQQQTCWLTALNLVQNRMLHSLVSLKYILAKGPGFSGKSFLYDSVGTFGDVHVFRNHFCLPLGYTYDSYIPFSDFHPLTPSQKSVVLQQAFVIDSQAMEGLDRFTHTDLYSLNNYAADLAKRKEDTLAIGLFRQNHIKGTITVSKNKLLFFSIPYDKGWSAKVDGVERKPLLVNIGFLGIPLNKGSHTVELNYTPPYIYAGLFLTIAGIFLYLVIMVVKSKRNKRNKRTSVSS